MSTTVDFGIDLGTTNSAIYRMTAKGPELIPIKSKNYVPSIVAIDKRANIKIGDDNPHYKSAKWFKRLMGSTNVVSLSDGKDWLPEYLSAEVLKHLKAAAKLRTNEDVFDVVITVPAMFTQPQCEATYEAARLAGLNAVSLLQEPIAAATAYLSDNPIEGYYLVYDLGGGTFDVSIVRLVAGEINVVEHGGDNYLGGADLDHAVFDWVLDQIDQKGGNSVQFKAGANQRLLLNACEDARISLSDTEKANIYLDDFDLPIAMIELSRERLEILLESIITRTIEIARDRVKSVPGGSAAINAVLLVGGPTQMPCVRTRIQAELRIALDLSQDPMTVVAKGAAIHAGTILKTSSARLPLSSPNSAMLDIFYEPVSPVQFAPLSGKVIEPSGFAGEIFISSKNGDWETGWITLTNSAFSTEVTLGRVPVTEYQILLRDSTGKLIECSPSTFVIRHGIRTGQPVTSYNYGVVLEGGMDNKFIIDAGKPLPATGTHEFTLAKTVLAGSPDFATIYFTEGNSRHALDNAKVGEIRIVGADLPRTLNAGEPLEIRIRMDESRLLKATVYVPIIDRDYVLTLHSRLETPDLSDLTLSVGELQNTMNNVEPYVDSDEQSVIMRAQRQVEIIEASLERVANGEIGQADAIYKQLADIKGTIRPLTDTYALQATYDSLISFIVETEALCDEFNDQMGLAKLSDIRQDATKALRLESQKTLDAIIDRVKVVFWQHYGKTRACWEYQVQTLRSNAHLAIDLQSFYELLHGAEKSLALNDYEGVRLAYLRAIDLVPRAARQENRFHDAALRAV